MCNSIESVVSLINIAQHQSLSKPQSAWYPPFNKTFDVGYRRRRATYSLRFCNVQPSGGGAIIDTSTPSPNQTGRR